MGGQSSDGRRRRITVDGMGDDLGADAAAGRALVDDFIRGILRGVFSVHRGRGGLSLVNDTALGLHVAAVDC